MSAEKKSEPAKKPEKKCTECKKPLAFLDETGTKMWLNYSKTSCGHILCYDCHFDFVAKQHAAYKANRKVPHHKCQICGRKNIMYSHQNPSTKPQSSQPPKHREFPPPSQCDLSGDFGYEYDETTGKRTDFPFSPSVLLATQKLTAAKVELIDVVAVAMYMVHDSHGALPYSMKRTHEIMDLLNQVNDDTADYLKADYYK